MENSIKKNRSVVSTLILALCLSMPFGSQLLGMEKKGSKEIASLKYALISGLGGAFASGVWDIGKKGECPSFSKMIGTGLFCGIVGGWIYYFYKSGNGFKTTQEETLKKLEKLEEAQESLEKTIEEKGNMVEERLDQYNEMKQRVIEKKKTLLKLLKKQRENQKNNDQKAETRDSKKRVRF